MGVRGLSTAKQIKEQDMTLKKDTKFLKDGNGKDSMMRLMSFLSLLFSFALTTIIATNNSFNYYSVAVIFIFVVAAFAPKVVQKFAESKLTRPAGG